MIGTNPPTQQDSAMSVHSGGTDGSVQGTGTTTAGTTSQPTTPQSTHTHETYTLALQQRLAMMTETNVSGPGSDAGTPQPDQAQITLGSSVGTGTGGTATPVLNKDSSATDANKQKVRPAAMDFQDLEAELHKIHTINKSAPTSTQQAQTAAPPPGMSAVTVGVNLAAAAAQFSPAQLHAQQIAPALLTTYVPAPYQPYQGFMASPHLGGSPGGPSIDLSGQPVAESSQQAMNRPGSNTSSFMQPQLIPSPLGPMLHPAAAVGISAVPIHGGPLSNPQYTMSPQQGKQGNK